MEEGGEKRFGGQMILAIVDDLMIGVRIEEAAKAIGASVEVVSSPAEASERVHNRRVDAVVADLAIAGLSLEGLAAMVEAAGARVIGFYPHVNVGLRRAAKQAGIDHVYPRSRFLRDLAAILREGIGA